MKSNSLGILDDKLVDYENTFGTKLGMNKAERLQTEDSKMTHAMVIVGVHLDLSGKPVRYRIENSWSDEYGTKGYFFCTAEWFRQYAYQIVVPKTFASPELVNVFESEDAVELPPWDPMGALA